MPQANKNKLVAAVFDDPYKAEERFKPKIIESDMPADVEREVTRALEHEQTAAL